MSTDPMFKCNRCEQYKLSGQYGTRSRADTFGQKGDCLSTCLSCNAKRKRKRTNSNPDNPGECPTAQPCVSPNQFMEDLAKYASATKIADSWHVSVDEMALADKEIANHLASLAWKVTGYRFRYAASSTFALRFTAHSNHSIQLPHFIYICSWFIYTVHLSMLSGPRNWERHGQAIGRRRGEAKTCSPYETLQLSWPIAHHPSQWRCHCEDYPPSVTQTICQYRSPGEMAHLHQEAPQNGTS